MMAMPSARSKLLSSVQELATAGSLDELRAVLSHNQFLCTTETDEQLTRIIRKGLERDEIDTVSLFLMVRGLLTQVRAGEDLEAAGQALGGLPLYRTDPIAALLNDSPPSADQAGLCKRALGLVRAASEPRLWADLHFLLANRLVMTGQEQTAPTAGASGVYMVPTYHLTLGHTPAHIKQAMQAYGVAGDTWQKCGEAEQAAQAHYALARLLINFSTGDERAGALRQAIGLLESTSVVWTRQAYPRQWGDVQAALSLALKNLPNGLDAPGLARAIHLFEAALDAPLDPTFNPTYEKAERQYHLAALYLQRYHGDRAAYVERAIELLKTVSNVWTREAYPLEWADAQNSLANAFQGRLRGDPADNMERAIQAYQSALEIWTEEQDQVRWATVHGNLGEAYRQRVLGRPEQNQEMGIACFRRALDACPPQRRAAQWASLQNSLANLCCSRLRGEQAANTQTGIDHYQQALEVYTLDAYPRQWAQTINNLANAYSQRAASGRSPREQTADLRAAIDLYQQALQVRTRRDYPREWAATQNNLGTAYRYLGQRNQAIWHFRNALTIRKAGALPDKALQTARNLGDLYFDGGRWREALKAYRLAEEASDMLYRQAITEAGKRAEIGRGGGVVHQAAYALARLSKSKQAVLALERGRARLLAEALARDQAALKRADPVHQAEYERAISEIRALESELRAAELNAQGSADTPTTARPFVDIARDLSSARQRLDRVTHAMRRDPGYDDFLARPVFDDVLQAIPVDRPLVYLVATSAGGLALIVCRQCIRRVSLPALTDEALQRQGQNWFEAYFCYHGAPRATREPKAGKRAGAHVSQSETSLPEPDWWATLDETTRWLWEVVMGAVVATLRELGVRQATLIPSGWLAFLPLHAAWHPGPDGVSRRYALDDVALAYAPSARALAHAQTVAANTPGSSLFAVNNPDGSLSCASQEVNAIARHFSKPQVAEGVQATKKAALAALPKCDVYHFACHGSNNWQNPLESAVWLHGEPPLTVEPLMVSDVMSVAGQFQARLAFLSACETGLVGAQLPDEMIGLPAGFVQAGTAGVVSSLWPVDDESAALVADRFYQNWKTDGKTPLKALVAAQQWLRDEAGGGWSHPHYWAALSLTGV